MVCDMAPHRDLDIPQEACLLGGALAAIAGLRGLSSKEFAGAVGAAAPDIENLVGRMLDLPDEKLLLLTHSSYHGRKTAGFGTQVALAGAALGVLLMGGSRRGEEFARGRRHAPALRTSLRESKRRGVEEWKSRGGGGTAKPRPSADEPARGGQARMHADARLRRERQRRSEEAKSGRGEESEERPSYGHPPMNPPEAGRRGCTRMHAFGGNGNDGAKSRRAEEARSWGNGGGIAFRAFGLRGVGGDAVVLRTASSPCVSASPKPHGESPLSGRLRRS
jgi:hypothetical protein